MEVLLIKDLLFVGENLGTWWSKKQNVAARSSAEAEFRALAHVICEGIWINKILEEMKMSPKTPIQVYCDDNVVIAITHNPLLHDRTKHSEVGKHFIKEKVHPSIMYIYYLPTKEQAANILTKGLSKKQFDKCLSMLAMDDIYKQA